MFQTHPTFDPACFIGWECRVVQFDKYVDVRFELVCRLLTLGVILYYTIISYTILLLYIIILYSTSLLFPSSVLFLHFYFFLLPLPSLLFQSSFHSNPIHSSSLSSSLPIIPRILVATYIRLFIFQLSFSSSSVPPLPSLPSSHLPFLTFILYVSVLT